MAQDVYLLQAERRTKLRELRHETFYAPEVLLRRVIGFPASELVVEDYRSFICKFCEWVQIVTWRTGSSVNQDKRGPRSTTDDPIPNATTFDIDITVARLEAAFLTRNSKKSEDDQPNQKLSASCHC